MRYVSKEDPNHEPPRYGTGVGPRWDLTDMQVGDTVAVAWSDQNAFRSWVVGHKYKTGRDYVTWRGRSKDGPTDELFVRRTK